MRMSDLGMGSCVWSLDDVHGHLDHERHASSSLQGPCALILGQTPRVIGGEILQTCVKGFYLVQLRGKIYPVTTTGEQYTTIVHPTAVGVTLTDIIPPILRESRLEFVEVAVPKPIGTRKEM